MRGHHQSWPDVRLDELRLLNPDTVGWLHMDDSPINYPVVRGGEDVDYYLTHNFSGEESVHGAVIMEGAGNLGDRTTVLCAHHMKDGSMFFALSKLYFPEYYETHRGMELLLADGLYRADFFAVNLIFARDPEPKRTDFSSDADYAEWIAERKKLALYPIPLTPDVRDRVLVMSTCVYPTDPSEACDELAAYAVLRKVEDRSLLPEKIEKRGAPPDVLRLVNVHHPLPEDFVPELVPTENERAVDPRCHADLSSLLMDCRADGGCPFVRSAYRSVEHQRSLFDRETERWMQVMGDRRLAMGAAAWRCAPPGASEHQLGLAVDLACEEEESAEFTTRWLARNAWRYGFILRYPAGKEEITGIAFEGWHYRFVGREAAEEIRRLDLTLEEYLELFYFCKNQKGESTMNENKKHILSEDELDLVTGGIAFDGDEISCPNSNCGARISSMFNFCPYCGCNIVLAMMSPSEPEPTPTWEWGDGRDLNEELADVAGLMADVDGFAE